nr:RNA-directed DNA polymerase, eukaryota, reverse transcriptase zinc-binding domain protein [Tanacetum cinerariifolium]
MFDIDNDKAPSPNGFTSCLFKKAWPIVGKDVSDAIKELFLTGKLLKEVNATMISLIPKMATPNKVSDFRPITLYWTFFEEVLRQFRFHEQMVRARGLRNGDPISPYLFTIVIYSKKVWDAIKGRTMLDKEKCEWDDIIGKVRVMHSKNNIKNILSKIGVAAYVYAIWRERNLRIFQDKKRNEDVLIREVTEDIKWKLASSTVKKSKVVSKVYEEWEVRPSYTK